MATTKITQEKPVVSLFRNKKVKHLVSQRMIKLNNSGNYGMLEALTEAKIQIGAELGITIK